jgi:hypothetical protein
MGGFMSCNFWNMPISSMPSLLLSLQILMVSGAIFEIVGVGASIYTLKICLNCSQRKVRRGGMIAGIGHLLGSLLVLTSGILALVIVVQVRTTLNWIFKKCYLRIITTKMKAQCKVGAGTW